MNTKVFHKQKTTITIYLFTIFMSFLNVGFAGQFLDEHGYSQGTIQENGKNGYIILDKNGYAEAYIQEDENNGYTILDSEGHAKGFYQED